MQPQPVETVAVDVGYGHDGIIAVVTSVSRPLTGDPHFGALQAKLEQKNFSEIILDQKLFYIF